MSGWGGPCRKCGHPASYHGMTFCVVAVGDGTQSSRRTCDCDGYADAASQANPPDAEVEPKWDRTEPHAGMFPNQASVCAWCGQAKDAEVHIIWRRRQPGWGQSPDVKP